MYKYRSLKKLAYAILASNQYMTLGTITEGKTAWVSPVVYAIDRDYNFYFMSLPESQHSRNITTNPQLSVAIFDSHQLFGEGVGIQMLGNARVVPIKQTPRAFKCYFGRKWPYGNINSTKSFKKFFKAYKYRFYKITPAEVWLNDPRRKYDVRVRVRL